MSYNYDKKNQFLPEGFELHLAPLIANTSFNCMMDPCFGELVEMKIGPKQFVEITRNRNIIARVMTKVQNGSRLCIQNGALCFDVTPEYHLPSAKFISTYLAFLGRPTFLHEFVYPKKHNTLNVSQSSLESSYSEPIYEMPISSLTSRSISTASFVSNSTNSTVETFGFPGEEVFDELITNPTYRSEHDAIPARTLNPENNAVDLICLDYDQTLNRSLAKLSNFITFNGLFSQQEHVFDEPIVQLIIQLLSPANKILSITSKNSDPTAIATFMEKILQYALSDELITLEMARNFRSRILICASPTINHVINEAHLYDPVEQILLSIDVLKKIRPPLIKIVFGSSDLENVHYINSSNKLGIKDNKRAVHIQAPAEAIHSSQYSQNTVIAFNQFVSTVNFGLYRSSPINMQPTVPMTPPRYFDQPIMYKKQSFPSLPGDATYADFPSNGTDMFQKRKISKQLEEIKNGTL